MFKYFVPDPGDNGSFDKKEEINFTSNVPDPGDNGSVDKKEEINSTPIVSDPCDNGSVDKKEEINSTPNIPDPDDNGSVDKKEEINSTTNVPDPGDNGSVDKKEENDSTQNEGKSKIFSFLIHYFTNSLSYLELSLTLYLLFEWDIICYQLDMFSRVTCKILDSMKLFKMGLLSFSFKIL